MNRHEYMDAISRTLSGRVSPDVQKETLAYYKDYIQGEIVKGNSEEMVLATLGDPKLLAKTVIASQPEPYGPETRERSAVPESEKLSQDRKLILILVVAVVVLLLVLGLVFSAILKLLPILIPAAAVFWIIQRIRGKRR